jgi:hypothetical protein
MHENPPFYLLSGGEPKPPGAAITLRPLLARDSRRYRRYRYPVVSYAPDHNGILPQLSSMQRKRATRMPDTFKYGSDKFT